MKNIKPIILVSFLLLLGACSSNCKKNKTTDDSSRVPAEVYNPHVDRH